MKLVVESGSSKADWAIIGQGIVLSCFQTKGFNPLFFDDIEMKQFLVNHQQIHGIIGDIRQVYFYSPGFSHGDSRNRLHDILGSVFKESYIYVESDLLAACRSVYHSQSLFVSILGTGSNTAFYDGKSMQQISPSLGFILADEGSGASLGRILLKDYLRKQLPEDIYISFSRAHSISLDRVLSSIYQEKYPNRFLASYVPFLSRHLTHDYVQNILRNEFQKYFNEQLLVHPLHADFTISFVGSVAFFFEDVLRQIALENGIKVSEIVQSPINGLVDYHLRN
jgi:N-acetylglucosamine kinase-like BadF-type ATPase